MTDWTTPEDVPEVVRERLHQWLKAGHPAHATTLANFAVAEVIRAFWPAPARTLADDLAHIAEHWEEWATDTIIEELTAATTSAEKMEQDAEERQEWNRNITKQVATLARERDEARALAERLAAENENLRRTDNYKEFKEFLTVQKGAESNAESLDPSDVKPGEAWKAHIWYDDVPYCGTAIKSSGGDWTVTRDDGSRTTYRMNEYVELVSRLVPAPRVITNPDELERLAVGTIIRDTRDGLVCQKKFPGFWDTNMGDDTSARDDSPFGPVTVLWEPGA